MGLVAHESHHCLGTALPPASSSSPAPTISAFFHSSASCPSAPSSRMNYQYTRSPLSAPSHRIPHLPQRGSDLNLLSICPTSHLNVRYMHIHPYMTYGIIMPVFKHYVNGNTLSISFFPFLFSLSNVPHGYRQVLRIPFLCSLIFHVRMCHTWNRPLGHTQLRPFWTFLSGSNPVPSSVPLLFKKPPAGILRSTVPIWDFAACLPPANTGGHPVGPRAPTFHPAYPPHTYFLSKRDTDPSLLCSKLLLGMLPHAPGLDPQLGLWDPLTAWLSHLSSVIFQYRSPWGFPAFPRTSEPVPPLP